MAVYGGPEITTSGLVLHLDIANNNCCIGSGNLAIEYLVVAGGGGGGGIGGGGGAGGLLTGFLSLASGAYSVVVGGGGTGGNGSQTSAGIQGTNSSFVSATGIGGGGGAPHIGSSTSGGSGGGGSYNEVPSNGTSGQGFAGGAKGTGSGAWGGGGGGGAASVGGNAAGAVGGAGGTGLYYDISGSITAYAGGGGGSNENGTGGAAGVGGGGKGGTLANKTSGTTGSANTGGGGGGVGNASGGGTGGSGIVIIRYKGPQKASGGNTVKSVNGFTIHIFTSSGTFTIGNNIGDLTGTHTGTLTNGAVYNLENKGSIIFDGIDDYILINNSTSTNISNNVTYAIWIRPSVNITNTGQNNSDVSFFRKQASGSGFILEVFGTTASNKQLSFWVNYPSGATTTYTLNANIWYYIVGTYDGSVAYLYVNGSQVATSSFITTVTTSADIHIGTFIPSSTPTRNFQGNISNCNIYNRALSATEILNNYNSLKGRYGL